MIVYLKDFAPTGAYDVCIVGAGPAGISCALGLARNGKRVLILEGGGEDYEESSQSRYEGTVDGDPYFDLSVARLRYFGGTSNHWQGWCRTLDAIDFETKPYMKALGWPIGKSDLDPYYEEAAGILEIGPIPANRPIEGSGLAEIYFVYSPPVRFGEKYSDAFAAHDNIDLVLHANLSTFITDGQSVSGLTATDYEGIEKTFTASAYVLAMGGIENTRFLQWGNALTNGALIKTTATLGAYWFEHPNFSIGEYLLHDRSNFRGNERGVTYFAPMPETILSEEILDCDLMLRPVEYSGLEKIVTDIACIAPTYGSWAIEAMGKNLICGGVLRAAWEQEPQVSNRIELSNDKDAFGVPRVVLHWRKSALDLKTVRTSAKIFGRYLADANLGRVRLEPWVLGEADYPVDDELAGYHHMGGTRMAASSSDGIVDANCKVFGQDNLYIAGSSVFASGGYANPTLTIVQLAVRLAEHLNTRISSAI